MDNSLSVPSKRSLVELILSKVTITLLQTHNKIYFKSCEHILAKNIGKRNGEKLHEEMISFEESLNAISINNYFIILQQGNNRQLNHYSKTSEKS